MKPYLVRRFMIKEFILSCLQVQQCHQELLCVLIGWFLLLKSFFWLDDRTFTGTW